MSRLPLRVGHAPKSARSEETKPRRAVVRLQPLLRLGMACAGAPWDPPGIYLGSGLAGIDASPLSSSGRGVAVPELRRGVLVPLVPRGVLVPLVPRGVLVPLVEGETRDMVLRSQLIAETRGEAASLMASLMASLARVEASSPSSPSAASGLPSGLRLRGLLLRHLPLPPLLLLLLRPREGRNPARLLPARAAPPAAADAGGGLSAGCASGGVGCSVCCVGGACTPCMVPPREPCRVALREVGWLGLRELKPEAEEKPEADPMVCMQPDCMQPLSAEAGTKPPCMNSPAVGGIRAAWTKARGSGGLAPSQPISSASSYCPTEM